jgi:hypothetical protein
MFRKMYHPNIPATITKPIEVAPESVDDHAARGWLLVDPSNPEPPPSTPYVTRTEADSRNLERTDVLGTDGKVADAALPARLTDAALRVALVPRAPTAFLDASSLPDGTLPQLGTGQAVSLFGNSPASISGGKIVHTPTAGTNKAAYIQADIGSAVTEIGASVEFPAADAGAIAFVLPLAPWANGSLTPAGVHFVCQGDGSWHVSTWDGATESPIYYAGRIGALTGAAPHKFVVEIDRAASSLVVRFPDGSTSPTISHANIAGLTSTYAIWELFMYDTVLATPVKIHAIWAAGTPARVDQAKPRYADLLKSINAAVLASMPTTKTIVAEPAGTTSSNVLTARVELGRVTIRRPASGKVSVDLSCFLGFKQRNIIAIAWFGYVAKDGTSASGDYTKAWRLGDTANLKADGVTAADWTLEQSYAGQVDLMIPTPITNGATDLVDIICCITRVNGADGDLKYRINDGAGQRVVLRTQAAG